MGTYTSVRGWLELNFAHRPAASEIIQGDDLYAGGWAFPVRPFNWTLYLFYGGDIRQGSLPDLRDQVERLAALPPVDDDGDRPDGLFLVTTEDQVCTTWEIRDGQVTDRDTPGLAWLGA